MIDREKHFLWIIFSGFYEFFSLTVRGYLGKFLIKMIFESIKRNRLNGIQVTTDYLYCNLILDYYNEVVLQRSIKGVFYNDASLYKHET